MTQQGFTAQVTCQQRELDKSTSPSFVINPGTDTLFNTNVTLAQLEVVCPDTQSYLSGTLLQMTRFRVTVLSTPNFRTDIDVGQH